MQATKREDYFRCQMNETFIWLRILKLNFFGGGENPDMIKVGICDENNFEFQKTYEFMNLIKKKAEIEVKRVNIHDLLLEVEEQTFDFHILVTEVKSDGKIDILEVVNKINKNFPNCQIIYLTDLEEYVSKVYETEHCYFLFKNKLEQVMPLAFEKALQRLSRLEGEYLKITSERRRIQIPVSQICYIERFQHQCKIVLIQGEYLCYDSLTQLLKRLPRYFVRCHTGYIINGRRVQRILKNMVCIQKNGEVEITLPVGRNYRAQVKHFS